MRHLPLAAALLAALSCAVAPAAAAHELGAPLAPILASMKKADAKAVPAVHPKTLPGTAPSPLPSLFHQATCKTVYTEHNGKHESHLVCNGDKDEDDDGHDDDNKRHGDAKDDNQTPTCYTATDGSNRVICCNDSTCF